MTRDLRTDRRMHKEGVFKDLIDKKDSRGLFRMVKNLAGWKTGGTPEAFLVEGRLTRNPRQMVEIQMTAFVDKVKKLSEKLPAPNGDPMRTLSNTMTRWEGWNNVPELELQLVGRTEMLELLKQLGSSHAYGHDGMDGASLSLVAESVANPVRHIVNISLKNSEFAQCWKVGRPIPLHKGAIKSPTDLQSFRPILLLPTLLKVTEKIVQKQLICHL